VPKATAKNVIDLGFQAEQFGKPADFNTETTGYVALVLIDQSLEVENHVGATIYAAADAGGSLEQKLNFKRIKNAEMYLTASELWLRIEAHERKSLVAGRNSKGNETIGSRALKNAEELEEKASNELVLIAGVPFRNASISGGAVESGHFSAVL